MSDLDQRRTTRDSGSIGDRAYTTLLNDELILALQEANASNKKHKPVSSKLTRHEHVEKPLTPKSLPAQHNPPGRQIALTQEGRHKLQEGKIPYEQGSAAAPVLQPKAKQEEVPSPLQPRTTDATRGVVNSAVSLLRTGLQKVTEVHSHGDGNTVLIDGKTESGKLTVTSYRVDEPVPARADALTPVVSVSEPRNQAGNPKNIANTYEINDVHIDYGRASKSAGRVGYELLASEVPVLDSTSGHSSASSARADVQLSVTQNIALTANNNIAAVSSSESVTRTTSSPVTRTTENPFTKLTASAVNENSIKELRQAPDYSKGTISVPTIAGVSDVVKPGGMNVAINVRSFSVDGQVKPLIPGPVQPLHSMPSEQGALYRTQMTGMYGLGTYKGFNGEPDSTDANLNPELNATKLKMGDKRYSLGAEIALAAITVAAGASRRRMEPTRSSKQKAEEQGAGEESTVAEAAAKISAHKRPTMLMNRQDNLIAIAEKRFDDANLGWLIAALNKNVSNQVELDGKYIVEFESRQVVILPVWDDIVEFYESNQGPFDNSRLITIVKQTMVDQELLEATLGPLFNT